MTDPLALEANGVGAGAVKLDKPAFDKLSSTGPSRYKSTDPKYKTSNRFIKTRNRGTFDDMKQELTSFAAQGRPSVFTNAPNRKSRAKVLDTHGQGTEVGKYTPKMKVVRPSSKNSFFGGKGIPLMSLRNE